MSDSTDKPTRTFLELKDLHVEYQLDEGLVQAVRGASYKVYPDETLALVG